MRRRAKNIFLTGRPGVGKTTVIRRVLERLPLVSGGFFTVEIREGGERVGFRIVTIDGAEAILAHKDFKTAYRVGKYGVSVEVFDRVGVRAVEEALKKPGVIVMDELGRMELYSELFCRTVIRALDAEQKVFGTIQARRNPFLDGVRNRPDTLVVTVNAGNREELPEKLLPLLSE